MANHSEWKALRKRLEQQGLRIEGGGSKNFKVFRGKELVTTVPGSPGGGRGLANQRAQLRRKGINI